ncbi:MAG: type II secretion system F family protein, partial [Gammaproteobacteria bacterium]|nr:type II secretion system F family protein [Gammaproteobacteria bacterium]
MAEKALKLDVFAWEGTDKKGNRVKGESRGNNANLIKAELRRQGVVPLKVKKKSALGNVGKGKAITPKDIAIFMRQLATMMASGVPLVQAFDIIGRGHENPNMQTLVMTVKGDVEGGSNLADSMRKHPLYFDDLVCNLIEAGEAAGHWE